MKFRDGVSKIPSHCSYPKFFGEQHPSLSRFSWPKFFGQQKPSHFSWPNLFGGRFVPGPLAFSNFLFVTTWWKPYSTGNTLQCPVPRPTQLCYVARIHRFMMRWIELLIHWTVGSCSQDGLFWSFVVYLACFCWCGSQRCCQMLPAIVLRYCGSQRCWQPLFCAVAAASIAGSHSDLDFPMSLWVSRYLDIVRRSWPKGRLQI